MRCRFKIIRFVFKIEIVNVHQDLDGRQAVAVTHSQQCVSPEHISQYLFYIGEVFPEGVSHSPGGNKQTGALEILEQFGFMG